MDFDAALATHQDWKVKLRRALSGEAKLDSAALGRDDCCTLGHWLLSEGKARYGGERIFRECVEAHRAFHSEAGKVADLINAGKHDEAVVALGFGSPYETLSMEVGLSIVQMRRLHAQAA